MAFDPARPRYTLPFAGKDYELLGTFALIEAVEAAAKAYVGDVAVRLVNKMPSTELARVVSAVLTASGHKVSAQEAGDILWNTVGLFGDGYDELCLHLYSFLSICLAPPGMRQQEAQVAGELMGSLASGTATASSASAFSDGGQASSGPPTPGA